MSSSRDWSVKDECKNGNTIAEAIQWKLVPGALQVQEELLYLCF
jgi:hypothetical protein